MFAFNRIYTVLFHICLWSVLFACVLLWRPGPPAPRAMLTNWQMIWVGIPFIALFYLHGYLLIPVYLSRKRTAAYIGLVLAALLGVTALTGVFIYMDSAWSVGTHFKLLTFRRMLPGLFFLMASASVGIFRENSRLEKHRKEKETEHLRTELSFLRGQVNPHFMLNVLNSMALLARRKSDLLEPVLMELAGLMSYMLYNTDNEKIRLEDEIKYLKAYIDLQMLRFGDDVRVRFNTPAQLNDKYIEPMLLIPLVENAFKHGIGLVKDPVIYIDMKIEQADRLCMTVENKCNPLVRQQESQPPGIGQHPGIGQPPGIGLKNLKKRLELIYPGAYEFKTTRNHFSDGITNGNWFSTSLNIPLQ